jgi:hypothetical protein
LISGCSQEQKSSTPSDVRLIPVKASDYPELKSPWEKAKEQ